MEASRGHYPVSIEEFITDDLISDTPDLYLLQGGAEASLPPVIPDRIKNLGVACLSKAAFGEGQYTNRERRIERLRLPSGKTLTALVSEPHPQAVTEPGNLKLTFMVRGFGEMPSAGKGSSAFNLHEEYARRCPDTRTVSIDRYGYSKYDSPIDPYRALKTGLEHDYDAAADLLSAAMHYAEDGAVTLIGTSAGAAKVLEMTEQNETAAEPHKLHIEKELLLIVPCIVAKNVPDYAKFRTGNESEMFTRIKTTCKFVAHVPKNFVEAAVKHPRDTLGCVGIIGTLALRPWLLPVLPAQFIGHTAGIDFENLLDITRHHNLTILAAENDPLEAESQFKAIEKLRPGTVNYSKVPQEGHISLPAQAGRTLDYLGIEPGYPSSSGLLEAGVDLASSAIHKLGHTASYSLAKTGRFVPSAIRRLTA